MKETKFRIIFLFSVVTYVIASMACLVCAKAVPEWFGLIIGFCIMLIALILHFVAKNASPLLYVVSSCINAVATGFSIGAYYPSTSTKLPVSTPFLLFLPYLILTFLILCFIQYLPKKSFSGILCTIILVGSILLCILHWEESSLITYGFFLLLIQMFNFVLSLRILKTSRNVLANLSLASFGIYLLVACVVAIIISDGDAAEIIFDLFDIDIHKKKNQIKL